MSNPKSRALTRSEQILRSIEQTTDSRYLRKDSKEYYQLFAEKMLEELNKALLENEQMKDRLINQNK